MRTLTCDGNDAVLHVPSASRLQPAQIRFNRPSIGIAADLEEGRRDVCLHGVALRIHRERAIPIKAGGECLRALVRAREMLAELVAIIERRVMAHAISFAQAAALATTKLGALASPPTRRELVELLRRTST